MSVPNQKVLTIKKQQVVPPFFQISVRDLDYVCQDLSGASLTLYFYLAKNQNDFRLELSPADIVDKRQLMSRRTYYRAVEELKLKQYIVDNTFYAEPVEFRQTRERIEKESQFFTSN